MAQEKAAKRLGRTRSVHYGPGPSKAQSTGAVSNSKEVATTLCLARRVHRDGYGRLRREQRVQAVGAALNAARGSGNGRTAAGRN